VVGQGATFRLRLPIAVAPRPADDGAAASQGQTPAEAG
jgi:hypothetical protein